MCRHEVQLSEVLPQSDADKLIGAGNFIWTTRQLDVLWGVLEAYT
jgi:hypothetical protein